MNAREPQPAPRRSFFSWLRARRERASESFYFSIFICFLLAGTCFWVEHLFREATLLSEASRLFFAGVFLHVGIAFIVAATIIAMVEARAHRIAARQTREFREQVSEDVFKALFGRIVPKEVFHEIDSILRYSTVRRNCKYLISFLPPYDGMPENTFVVRRQVTYTVTNLLNQQIIFEARSSHSEDIETDSKVWGGRRYHLKLLIDGKEIPLDERNLKVDPPFVRIAQEVPLGPNESKEISFHGEEPAPVSASRISYLQATPVIGIEVSIVNSYPARIGSSKVEMNHPGANKMKIDGLGRYVLDSAFLPGQGFQVTWKEAQGDSTTFPAEEKEA